MKKYLTTLILLLVINFAGAQSKTYDALWKKVEQFEIDGLPKSALEIVNDISSKAKTDSNDPQIIKSLLYKSKFALVLEEDAQLNIINDLKVEIGKTKVPTKNILENILADLYWQYFQQNRYKFYNRTKTETKVDDNDFRTWDLETLFNEIHVYFQRSLKNWNILRLERLVNYDDILVLQNKSKLYRPTLYDLLAHNALNFYKTSENSISRPAYKFKLEDTNYLSDAKSFAELHISSRDSTALQLNALKIYQDLIRFHLKDSEHFALEDVNIARLKFVKQNAVFNNKDHLFLEALKTEALRLGSHKTAALYNFEIASVYFQQGLSYQPETNETHRWKLKEALNICNTIIKIFPVSRGTEKCSVLKGQILQSILEIRAENFLPVQQNARLLVSYKNLKHLDFKVYKITQSQIEQLRRTHRKEEQYNFIKGLSLTTQWQSKLRDENDYQRHSTEIVFPKLDNGSYVILTTTNGFMTFAFKTIQVTNLALVEKNNTTHKIYQLINRNNGKPIVGATVNFSHKKRYYGESIYKQFVTDSLGEFHIKKLRDHSIANVKIEVSFKTDKAYFGDYYINRHYSDKEEKLIHKAFVFTDRSIYRPGQTVYFKGIAMQTKDGKSEVLENESVLVILYNTNDEVLEKKELYTNKFGSVSGEFILPSNGLNGEYYLGIHGHKKSFDPDTFFRFSVEEYKRPNFEARFNTVTETYRVNDSITINGEALAYAGSHITDAKVVYRVYRKVQYPRWYYWYRPWFNSEPQEITHGETITSNNGDFNITFKALPDDSADKSSLPVFHYEITADVTDINGETRSATTIVNVGYHALTASIAVDDKLDSSKNDHTVTIDTKNLNGEFVPATGTVKIYKLQAPGQVLRSRPWSAPDYQDITEEEFKKLFPHDPYHNEDNSNNWKKGKLILEKTFDTQKSKAVVLGNMNNWASGQYIIVLETKDKFGQPVKDEAKSTVFNNNDKSIADNQLFNISTNKESYNTEDTVELCIASAANNITVTIDIEKDHNIINTYVVQLNNDKSQLSIPVTKEDLGGFAVHYSFAAFNGFRAGKKIINVPYPKTELEIETTTFRDKLQPGQEETWTFNIKGPKGDKVSAELLAGMYDASLDQFKSHHWIFNPILKPLYYAYSRSRGRGFGTQNFRTRLYNTPVNYPHQNYDRLNWFGFHFGNYYQNRYLRGEIAAMQIVAKELEVDEESVLLSMDDKSVLDEIVVTGIGNDDVGFETKSKLTEGEDSLKNEEPSFDSVQIRKNLNETAFFYPDLKTDKDGNVSFSFTTPEALTRWKLQLLAHTKTLESATTSLETVTQKELMVIPNAPRFLREGDRITISSKISNLSENKLEGQAILKLFDAITGNAIDTKLGNSDNNKAFAVDAKGNTQVSWNLNIPDDIQAVQYKVIARAGDFSDGEQNALPVLSNRMLVTETLPMWIRSNQTRTFTLDKLKTNTSTSLKHHKLTLEMTSNPAWYAVQALPYLMEYPYDCNEQIFARYYANALASHIANSNPRIQEVFNQWKSQDVLMSNLEKNAELKSILIQETPWLRDAQSETEQKKRIALLFDLNKMKNELKSAKRKLKNNQMPSGAWAWFNGGYENRFITQHIITGFGHLKQLKASTSAAEVSTEKQMIENAIRYLDKEFVKEYKDIRKYNAEVDLSKDHLSYTQLHYLYMRSFYPEIILSKAFEDIRTYYFGQIQKYWLSRSLYAKGLMALVMHRKGDTKMAGKILKSLKENSISSDESGMYWKENSNSWYWYQAPIETQALLIEAFSEIANNTQTIDDLKIWLLKNKQTNRWKTTKATTEAVYALLLQGSDWLSVTDMVDVAIGDRPISPTKLENVKVEAGTGYYKTSWNPSEIQPKMANVKISIKGKGIAWGSLYWQYFEDLDKITSAETPLQLKKKLFLKRYTDMGEELSEITDTSTLKIGDLIRVRIELRVDRAMEFVHMKDMRASGLEPINVLSQYKWQDGLGYYESTKDASTNFFFDLLPKGVYVFEYDLRVNNAGDFSNGITTIQSMYAPEFSSHSKGVRITVK